MLCSRNGAGDDRVRVTVPAESSAVAVMPAGMKAPRNGLLFSGSSTQVMLAAAVFAVNVEPSEQVTPLFSVKVAVVPSSLPCLREATAILPLASTLTRGS